MNVTFQSARVHIMGEWLNCARQFTRCFVNGYRMSYCQRLQDLFVVKDNWMSHCQRFLDVLLSMVTGFFILKGYWLFMLYICRNDLN